MLKTERLFMQKPCFFVIFQCFFPDVRPDAPPDRRDTTHLGRAPEAHYRRTGQTGPRRAVRNVHSFVRILGGVWSGFVLPLLIRGGPSWGGPEIHFLNNFCLKNEMKNLSGDRQFSLKRTRQSATDRKQPPIFVTSHPAKCDGYKAFASFR